MLRKLSLSFLLISFCSAALASTSSVTGGLTFSSVSHNFGSVAVGQSSSNYGVQVTNTSGSALTFAVNLTSSSFTQTNTCGSSIGAGDSCNIVFNFTPASSGSQSTTWTVTSNASSYSPSDGGTLSGTGATNAGVSLSTSYHNFGGQVQNTASSIYGVVLSNSTSDPVSLSINTQPTNYVDFPVYLNNCQATLPANGQCILQWQFQPASTISYNTEYTISATDTVTNQVVNITSPNGVVTGVTLLGQGINPGVTLTSASRNFGEQAINTTSQPYGITLYNGTGSSIQLTYGTVPSGFTLASDTCGSTVAAGASCNASFEFTPTTTGTFGGNISVSATSNGSPVTLYSGGQPVTGVSLSGTGTTAGMAVTTSAHNFGYYTQGESSQAYGVQMSNKGADAVELTFAFSSGTQGFTLVSNSCSATLASGKNCELIFTFNPTANTPMNAVTDIYKITATDASTGMAVNIADATDGAIVSGITLFSNVVTTSGMGATSDAHNFGEIGVGGSAAEYGVVIYNTGSASANLTSRYASSSYSSVFALDSNNSTCPGMNSIPANGSCTLAFHFQPTSSGYYADTYQVSGAAQSVAIALSGTGVN